MFILKQEIMEKLTIEELELLVKTVNKVKRDLPHLRLGQCLFNCLYDMKPELANSVRATENDPFYRNDKIKDFFKAICSEEAFNYLYP